MDKLFVCQVCGYIAFGAAPDICPVCFSPKDKFKEDAAAIKPAATEGKEKHVPVITVFNTCGLIPGACRDVHVKVGSVPHPMEEKHWIKHIDVYLNKNYLARYMMNPQSLQAAVGIHLKSDQKGTLTAIENCNLHGSWMAETEV